MAKHDNLSQYWQEMAAKAGLDEAQVKAVAESLGDETVAKVFKEAFVPVPDHHSTIDRQKTDFQQRLEAAQADGRRLTEWYEKEAKPAYEQNLGGVQSLKQYQELYGPLDGTANSFHNNGTPRNDAPVNTVTRDELEKMFRERDEATVVLTKTAMRVSGDYAHRFKEPMSAENIAELEKVAVDNHISLDKAYELWIAPKVADQKESAMKAKFETEKAEAVRDALSQRNLPVDSKPQEHPFFNPVKVEGEPTPADVRARSRDAFTQGWNEAAE